LDKAKHKIKLEEAKVGAAQATLIHSMNESFEATVTKVNDDSKIFTAYTSTMDDDANAWYKMAHARIMKEMVVASEAE
jgi:hypothetical protein